MPRTVYSTRFAAWDSSAESPVVYTVPSGFVGILRDLDVTIFGEGAEFDLVDGTSGAFVWVVHNTASTSTSFQWRGRLVIPEGAVVAFEWSPGADVWGVASGYVLTA